MKQRIKRRIVKAKERIKQAALSEFRADPGLRRHARAPMCLR